MWIFRCSNYMQIFEDLSNSQSLGAIGTGIDNILLYPPPWRTNTNKYTLTTCQMLW